MRCGSKRPQRIGIPASGRLRQFDETVLTYQRLMRAFQPGTARIVGSDELRGSVTLKLPAGMRLCAMRIADLTAFYSDSICGSFWLRVVTTDLTFVHYLSFCWLDCPGVLMSGGARDRFSALNRGKNKRAVVAGQSICRS
jgi:hypothetical protein